MSTEEKYLSDFANCVIYDSCKDAKLYQRVYCRLRAAPDLTPFLPPYSVLFDQLKGGLFPRDVNRVRSSLTSIEALNEPSWRKTG